MNKLLTIAVNAALDAAKQINIIYNDPASDFEIERKSDNSPLTKADKKSNDVIMGYLADTTYPVLSEEGKTISYDQRKEWDTLWIVDPLDGTKEFIKRNGEFSVNIALVNNGIPVLGVIYLPVKQILYFAAEGIGSYRIKISEDEKISDLAELIDKSDKLPVAAKDDVYRIVASRSHCSEETKEFIAALEKEHGKVELVSSGSSIKICMVADGSADIYPRFAPTMEWDTAAGHAIALYAGKQIYMQDNESPLIYNKEDLLNPWFIVR